MRQSITVGSKIFLLAPAILCSLFAYSQRLYHFSGHLEDHGANDTVYLSIWHDIVYTKLYYQEPHREMACPLIDGFFHFEVDGVRPGDYMELGHGRFHGVPLSMKIMSFYRIEPGDSVFMTGIKRPDLTPDPDFPNNYVHWPTDGGDTVCSNCSVYAFAGRGAAKYECTYRLDTTNMYLNDQWEKPRIDSFFRLKNPSQQQWLNYHWTRAQFVNPRKEKLLFAYRASISPTVFRLMLTDELSADTEDFWYMTNNLLGMRTFTAADLKWIRELYKAHLCRLPATLQTSAIANSQNALSLLQTRARLENRLFGDSSVYMVLKKEYTGRLRDRLLTSYLVENYAEIPGADTLLRNALSTVTDERSWEALRAIADQQSIGRPAFDFSLPDSSGHTVSLHDFPGKVVFMDFWYTGCTGCSAFYQNTLSKVEEHYKNNPDIVFISVSIDGNKEQWMRSVASGKYSGSLARNVYTGGKGYEDPVIKAYNVLTYPRPLVIDKDGRLFNNSAENLRSGIEDLEKALNKALNPRANLIRSR